MSWRDLLEDKESQVIMPWTGGRLIFSGPRKYEFDCRLPREFGWYKFSCFRGKIKSFTVSEPDHEKCWPKEIGYLAGNRFISENASAVVEPSKLWGCEQVYFIEPGIDMFTRVRVSRFMGTGPLLFIQMEMPLGPESLALSAFLDGKENLVSVSGITPAIEAVFRLEKWKTAEAEKRRAEIERQRKEEEERKLLEERREEIARTLGTGIGRRELTKIDFDEAAKAALAVGGAEFIDARPFVRPNEMTVRFRFIGRRFDCVCNKNTLQIVEAGVCLTDESTGIRTDSLFTLESLPPVIEQAHDLGVLVITRS